MMSPRDEIADPEEFLRAYRIAVSILEDLTDERARAVYQEIVDGMRAKWAACNGVDFDKLHETAFGG